MTKQLYLRDLILMAKAGKRFVAWMEAGAEHPFNLFSKPDVDWTRDEITEPWTCEEIREPREIWINFYPSQDSDEITLGEAHQTQALAESARSTDDGVTRKFREVLPGDES